MRTLASYRKLPRLRSVCGRGCEVGPGRGRGEMWTLASCRNSSWNRVGQITNHPPIKLGLVYELGSGGSKGVRGVFGSTYAEARPNERTTAVSVGAESKEGCAGWHQHRCQPLPPPFPVPLPHSQRPAAFTPPTLVHTCMKRHSNSSISVSRSSRAPTRSRTSCDSSLTCATWKG
eukprot:353288-Chlamydomonas_euryale.AAC.1